MAGFQLTYSTIFAAAPELHELFDAELVRVGQAQGREHALFIDGCDVFTDRKSIKRSPIDQRRILGQRPIAGAAEVDRAMRAASDALKGRCSTPWSERVYKFVAPTALEVGKNRMEALGEIQEAADFFKIYVRPHGGGRRVRVGAAG